MKCLLKIALFVITLVTFTAQCLVVGEAQTVRAELSGKCGEKVRWAFNEKTHTLSIAGKGDMYDFNSADQPWNSFKSSIAHVSIGNGVTSIGSYSFNYCKSLSSVHIPSSVKKIGDSAFRGCTYLKSISFPNVSSIDSSAFERCYSIESIFIPSSLTSIGVDYGAFYECMKLKSIDVDPNNQFFSSKDGILFNKDFSQLIQYPGGKEGNYIIPSSVEEIGPCAFRGCERLTSVTITSNVISIGGEAFYGSGLETITIPATVDSLGIAAFGNCKKLLSINVDQNNPTYKSEDGVLFRKTIYKRLIQYPAGITNTSYTVPDTITEIYYYAFSGCKSLSSINLGKVEEIRERAFFINEGLTSITIPRTVKQIDDYNFIECNNLISINVDSNNPYYTSVDGVLFAMNNPKLKAYPAGKTNDTYIVPDTVRSISPYAFSSCKHLTSIIIPKTVTIIGVTYPAFYECANLWNVTYQGTSYGSYCGNGFAQNCEALSFIYTPNGFNSKTLCEFKTITNRGLCEKHHDQENPCFKYILDDNDFVLRERDNVTLWKTRNNGCNEYVCNNVSGAITSINICQGRIFVELDVKEKKLKINEIDVDELVSIISNMTSIEENKLDIKIETDSEGYVHRIIVFVSEEQDAFWIRDAISTSCL